MTAKPLKVVMIRRGDSKVSNVPSENLITFIRKKILLGTDELSGDGTSWIRVDQHYQLRNYFLINEEAILGSRNDPELDGSINPNLPPGLKDDFEEMASMLKDINE
jgi:hypothetical protein